MAGVKWLLFFIGLGVLLNFREVLDVIRLLIKQ
mgnify:CR=1 FL=1